MTTPDGATAGPATRIWIPAGLAACAASAAAWSVPALTGGPDPPLLGSADRPWAAYGLPAVAAIGFLLAAAHRRAGAALAAAAALAIGGLGAFHHHPAVAAATAAAILVPAAVLLLAGPARRAARLACAAALGAAAFAVALGVARGHHFMYGATHPSSTIPGPPGGEVAWAWTGAVDRTRATVVARVPARTDSADLELSPPDGRVRAERSGDVVRFSLTGLRPGTRYRYAVRTGRVDDASGRGAFRTFPRGPASFTVAFSSCARSGSNGAVFDAIRAERPLAYLILGDMYYANVDRDDPDRFRRAYDRALTRPAQANLYRSTAVAYVWDDHDYGPNDADGTSPSGPAAHRVYRERTPHYPLGPHGSDAPIGQAFTIGRVRFIVTDTRSGRSPRGAPAGTMLGAAQRAWFARELVAANGRYPVIVWVNPTPWMGDAHPGADGWAGYADERREIADLIVRTRVRGLVMLSGDTHAVALDDGTHSGYASGGGGGFPVLHAGALDREPHRVAGGFSHGVFPGGGHYGTLTVVDDGGSRVGVVLRGRDWRGRELTVLRRSYPAAATVG